MKLVKATPDHARDIVPSLRISDKLEAERLHGLPASFGVLDSLVSSRQAWTLLNDAGEPAVLGGVATDPVCNSCGLPWLVATKEIYERPVTVVRLVKRHLMPKMKKGYKVLHGLADAEHTRAHRWLRCLGFELDTSKPYLMGDQRWPFYYFWCEVT